MSIFTHTPEMGLELTQSKALEPLWDSPPLVSVIMPVYNAASTVIESIESVIRQTYPHWELIVVVDGSPDNSLEVLQRFLQMHPDNRIQLVVQENQGTAITRNNGFRRTMGEYIALLDADDIWLPHKLQKELDTLQRYNTAVGYTYSWYYAMDDNRDLVNLSPPFTDSGMIFEAVLNKENLIIPSTALLHRSIFEDIGGFYTCAHHEDFLFFLLASKKYPGFPTQERLVLYRQSTSGRARNKLKDLETAKKAYINSGEAIQVKFSSQDYEGYLKRQQKTLFYAFMMYNHMSSAKSIYKELTPEDILEDLKGKLCLISMKTGVNMLFVCRTLYQFVTRFILRFWWKRKMSTFFQTAPEARAFFSL